MLECNKEDWSSCQGWQQATEGVSGAQVTKNSSRLEFGTLQMAAPVPKLLNCAESSAATPRIIWFCCRWWPVQSFRSHSVCLKNGILWTPALECFLFTSDPLEQLRRTPSYAKILLRYTQYSLIYTGRNQVCSITALQIPVTLLLNFQYNPHCHFWRPQHRMCNTANSLLVLKNLFCLKSGSASYWTITASLFKLTKKSPLLWAFHYMLWICSN